MGRTAERRGRLRVLLMGGVETRFHHFDEVGPVLARLVVEAGHECTQLLAPDALRSDVLWQFDAIVSITTGGELSDEAEALLLRAVGEPRNDAGRPLHFLGLHGASCSFDNSRRYFEMLGGRFLGHGPMTDFEVVIAAPEHPVTAGVRAFVIHDELYRLELCSEVEVLLTAPDSDAATSVPGGRLPLGWARRFGAGKVCYFALGHGPAQLEHPSVRELVHRALSWFATD